MGSGPRLRLRMKVYTRKGDDGTTGLLYGSRVGKDSAGPSAYGEGDEAVSALGLARSPRRPGGRGGGAPPAGPPTPPGASPPPRRGPTPTAPRKGGPPPPPPPVPP